MTAMLSLTKLRKTFNEGTVRPVLATIVCPSVAFANSMNAHAAGLFLLAFGRQ